MQSYAAYQPNPVVNSYQPQHQTVQGVSGQGGSGIASNVPVVGGGGASVNSGGNVNQNIPTVVGAGGINSNQTYVF